MTEPQVSEVLIGGTKVAEDHSPYLGGQLRDSDSHIHCRGHLDAISAVYRAALDLGNPGSRQGGNF